MVENLGLGFPSLIPLSSKSRLLCFIRRDKIKAVVQKHNFCRKKVENTAFLLQKSENVAYLSGKLKKWRVNPSVQPNRFFKVFLVPSLSRKGDNTCRHTHPQTCILFFHFITIKIPKIAGKRKGSGGWTCYEVWEACCHPQETSDGRFPLYSAICYSNKHFALSNQPSPVFPTQKLVQLAQKGHRLLHRNGALQRQKGRGQGEPQPKGLDLDQISTSLMQVVFSIVHQVLL